MVSLTLRTLQNVEVKGNNGEFVVETEFKCQEKHVRSIKNHIKIKNDELYVHFYKHYVMHIVPFIRCKIFEMTT